MKLLLVLLLFCFSASGITIEFGPHPDPSVSYYVLHYGTNSRQFLVNTNIGNATNFTLIDSALFTGTNYLSVTAVSSNDVELGVSATEIVYVVWPAHLKAKVRLSLESANQPIGPWQEVASIAYSDAALTNRFYRGKVYLQ